MKYIYLFLYYLQSGCTMADLKKCLSPSDYLSIFILRAIVVISIVLQLTVLTGLSAQIISTGDSASLYGVWEREFEVDQSSQNPYFDSEFRVIFTRPDGSEVQVDGFYDGNNFYKVRAYCDTIGIWQYQSHSHLPELDGKQGRFTVIESHYPGKLRIHPGDRRQFAYDNGEWFLHLGDTGYRYVVRSEPKWQEYIDEAAEAGFTKIRTWFAQSRHNVEALYTADRTQLNLEYWQEIERRLRYALEMYPHIIFQLIPYAEDTQELIRYGQDDPLSKFIARYAQARWSAFPNIHWEVSNDREVVEEEVLSALTGRQISRWVINKIGEDMSAREPWGTLITNQQSRFAGYSFVKEPWSDIITLEDLDEVAGELIAEYRQKGDDPVVLDEDRYENYRNPANDRYFYRRYMWANLLSGGHATYGGLRTYEAYDGGPFRGVQGYFTSNRRGVLSQGAHDFRYIHIFFKKTGLSLAGMTPDDNIVGGNPYNAKCIHDQDNYIIYLANPGGDDPRTDNPSNGQPEVEVALPPAEYRVSWYNPRVGLWEKKEKIVLNSGQSYSPQAPDTRRVVIADWVLFIQRL
jgi:hypothetical protein